MNYRLIARLLGRVLMMEAAAMLLPLAVSWIYGDGAATAFLASIGLLAAAGALLAFGVSKPDARMQAREGFFAVAMSWLALSAFGALPAVFSGAIPRYIDALFETVSGFTTTGASILHQAEGLPESILFWRSFTHWLGGMGVLILALAILPAGGRGIHYLMQAESPGPAPDRIVPRLRRTALILYVIYLALSALLTALLLLGGMNLFDALVHMFGTAGTGGFSSRSLSVGAYGSPYLETVIGVFMLLFSLNFGLYFAALTRRFERVRKDTELKVFLGIVAAATLLIGGNLLWEGVYATAGTAARHSFFQVSSIISTTGFSTTDFNAWPEFSRSIMLILMAVGACAGSTGGGIKTVRVVILFKAAVRELKKILHPRSVNVVRVSGKTVSDEMLAGVMHFFVVYVLILIFSTLLVSLDNKGFETSFTAVLTTLSNVGPGLGAVGPMGNFASFSVFSKSVLVFCMLAGRLEIFPILMLFVPSAWRRA